VIVLKSNKYRHCWGITYIYILAKKLLGMLLEFSLVTVIMFYRVNIKCIPYFSGLFHI